MQFNSQRSKNMSRKQLTQPKVALITGAARRIGAEIARFLHAQGFNIIVHYYTSEKSAIKLCADLNKQRSHSAFPIKADIAKTMILKPFLEKSAKKWGRLDVLINNAAAFQQTKMGKITEKAWETLIDTNVKAPLFLSQAAAPYLAKQKGCIINIADIHGEKSMRHYPVYSISKAGLLMLTKALARELAPKIRVNAISPGPTLWPEGKNALSSTLKTKIINRTILKKHGDPLAIAKAAYYLIEHATSMTGQNIILDGGRSLFL
jgi:pteridine reductase